MRNQMDKWKGGKGEGAPAPHRAHKGGSTFVIITLENLGGF